MPIVIEPRTVKLSLLVTLSHLRLEFDSYYFA